MARTKQVMRKIPNTIYSRNQSSSAFKAVKKHYTIDLDQVFLYDVPAGLREIKERLLMLSHNIQKNGPGRYATILNKLGNAIDRFDLDIDEVMEKLQEEAENKRVEDYDIGISATDDVPEIEFENPNVLDPIPKKLIKDLFDAKKEGQKENPIAIEEDEESEEEEEMTEREKEEWRYHDVMQRYRSTLNIVNRWRARIKLDPHADYSNYDMEKDGKSSIDWFNDETKVMIKEFHELVSKKSVIIVDTE